MNAIHSKNSTPCSFCEFIAKDEHDLKNHVVEKHGDSAIISIVGNQQLLLLETISLFKEDMANVLNTLTQGQNFMKSELLLLKEDITVIKKNEKKENEKKENEKKENEKKENEKKENEKKENEKKENEKIESEKKETEKKKKKESEENLRKPCDRTIS